VSLPFLGFDFLDDKMENKFCTNTEKESHLAKPKYDVFLSHATPDKPVVEALARILSERKFSPWLDKWNLVPGDPWQEAIEKALEDCAACAVCLGPSGTGPWQIEEMRAAIAQRVSDRSRQFRVIPVLLPGSERGEPSRYPAFLRATTWVEFRETLDDEKALHRLISGIQGMPPGPDPGEAVAEGACPYRGLQVFDVGDALFFFGREALTEWLLDKLRTDRSGSRFLAIVGPSGSGKSSLARAGLLASLKSGKLPGSDIWPIAICKPGAQPLESLAVALSGVARLGDSPSALRDLIRDLGADPHLLHLTTRLSLRDAPADRRLVVFIDQFEEVFTLCPEETQRRAIIDNLLHAATVVDGQTVVVLTLRADFYGRCATYPDLAAAVSDRQSLIGPMTRGELQSAIERPAYLTGCELEGGLADLLLNEVESQPGSLPLLEHALLQIWDRKEGGRRLTIAAYHEIGGVAGALEKHAEEVYGGFSEEEQETCHQIFLRLVQVDEQGRATKRRLGLDELASASVVSRLTNARLLTTDQEKQPTVELAHEALLNNWGRLRQWIEQDREALRTRRRLDEAVAEWLGKNRDPSFLLEGGRLVQVEEWAESHKEEMGADARELLEASIAERDQERQRELAQAKVLEEEQRRRADAEHQRAEEQAQAGRRLKAWTAASAAMTALAVVGALTVFFFWRASERQRELDLAGHLAERSSHILGSDPLLSLLLSIEANRLAQSGGQPHLPSAEGALRVALFHSRGVSLPTGKVRAAFLSADGKWMAIAGMDGVTSLWSLEPHGGPVEVAKLPAGRPSIQARQIAVSSGGQWLLVADQNGDSHLFQMKDFKRPQRSSLDGEDWLSGTDPFSPDGRWLLTRSKDLTWKVRSLVRAGQPVSASLEINPTAIAFSKDGRWLATAEPASLKIWSLNTLGAGSKGLQISQDVGFNGGTILAFNSDSQWLFAARKEDSRSIRAWKVEPGMTPDPPLSLSRCEWDSSGGPDLSDPALVRLPLLASCLMFDSNTFTDAFSRPSSEQFSAITLTAKGDKLAIGSENGMLGMKSLNPPGLMVWEQGFQTGKVHFVAFSNRLLISQCGDEAPRVFGENILPIEPAISVDRLNLVAIAPSGIAVRSDFELDKIWLQTPHGSWDLGPAREQFLWLFSTDGHWLANSSPAVWHLDDNGKPSSPIPLGVHQLQRLTALALSPDGHWLAGGDKTGQSLLWDLRDPSKSPSALVNHNGAVNALAFNSDGHLLAAAGEDGMVRISSIRAGQAPRPLPESPGNRGAPIRALAFLPGDRLAIAGLTNRVLLWKPGEEIALGNAGVKVQALASNPKGDPMAGFGKDGTLQLWYFTNKGGLPGPVIFPSETDPRHIPLINFTSDGQGLESAYLGNLLLRWELRTEKLLNTACRAAGRNLTEREWKEYIPSEPYQKREPCPELPQAFD